MCRHCRMCFFKWADISKLFSQTPHWCSLVEVPAVWVLESGTLLPFASFLSSPHSSVPSPAQGFRYSICWLSNFTADRVTCLPGNDLWPDLFRCLVSDMLRHWGWAASSSSSNSGSTNLQPFTSGSASSTLHTCGGWQSRAIHGWLTLAETVCCLVPTEGVCCLVPTESVCCLVPTEAVFCLVPTEAVCCLVPTEAVCCLVLVEDCRL